MTAGHLYFEGVKPSPRPRVKPHIVPRPRMEETLPAHVADFFSFLFRSADLSVDHYRPRSLNRRLPACLRRLGVANVQDARARLECAPALTPALVETVLLGVTEFWRDRPVFERLEREWIPRLIERFGDLRVWSAACSSGHELYSVAMLLDEAGHLKRSRLLGTDCRREAIARARSGLFSAECVAKVAAPRRERFFRPYAPLRYITPLRASVHWCVADLFDRTPRGLWHLILWRNMAIYLNPSAAAGVWRRLCDKLPPGGVLVTGKADHPPPGLPLERVGPCIYRKKDQ